MSEKKINIMIECALMTALAAGLSQIKLFHLPFGGSITLVSMLPIMVFGLRRGFPQSLICSSLYAAVHMVIDMHEVMSWGLTLPAVLACFFLDYLLAYAVLGVIGLFSKKPPLTALGGVVIALFLRFLVHFISGVVLWHSTGALWSGFPADNEILYSLVYNGAYMMPEIVFTVIVTAVLFKVPQTKKILDGTI